MRTPRKARVAQDQATANCGPRICSRAELVRAIHAVANGDKTAFTSIYTATAAKLFGIIVRIVRRRDVAEDILQEVYLRIWQNAHAFDADIGSPITWMVTIARHRALDEARRKSTMRPLDECPEVFDLASRNDLLDEGDEKRSRNLAAALQHLSREKRSTLVQAYCYGLTREEIASSLGCPVSTVKAWLRRSLAELKGHVLQQESDISGAGDA